MWVCHDRHREGGRREEGEGEGERKGEGVCVCVCVCVREREREKENVCVRENISFHLPPYF